MIKREKYISQIRNFNDSDLIKVLVGIRRCGKSVILQSIMEEIKEMLLFRINFILKIPKLDIFHIFLYYLLVKIKKERI